jgi:hypothetical protein
MTVPSSQHHRQQSTDGYNHACLCQSAKNSTSDGASHQSHNANEHFHATTARSSSSWTTNTCLCSHCVRNVLHAAHDRHAAAIQRHATVRRECARHLETSSIQGNLSQLQFEMEQANDRLNHLREKCAAAAVQVATAVHQNEEQRAKIPARVTLQTMLPTSNTSNSAVDDDHTIQLPMTATVTLRQRQQLERLQIAIQDEAMMTSIQEAQSQVRRLRWQWALQAFAMHRLDVEEPVVKKKTTTSTTASTGSKGTTATTASATSSSSNNNSRKQARGIGKIGGLPLPHAGPELYGVLPPNELQSALRLTASVTASVARCLGIILPHPVLLQPGDSPIRDIVEMAVQHGQHQHQHAAPNGNTTRDTNNMDDGDAQHHQEAALPEATSTSTAAFLSTSTVSLASLMGQTAKKAIARATGQQLLEETVAQVAIQITMEPALVQQRLHHAVAAVLAEANTTSTLSNNAATMGSGSTASTTRYALSATATASDEFAIALQLLQNNIVALCIRAGVPVTALWPAEAVLLNLHALQVYCRGQLSQ